MDDTVREHLKLLFPDHGELDARNLTRIHRIVLGFIPRDLETELKDPSSLKEIDACDSTGRTALHVRPSPRKSSFYDYLHHVRYNMLLALRTMYWKHIHPWILPPVKPD